MFFIFLLPLSGEGFYIVKILRGKQVRILYSTRCCKFREGERQNVTVERWEDAVSGTSQKTCRLHVVVASGGRRIQMEPFSCYSFHIDRSILLNLNAEDYTLVSFIGKQGFASGMLFSAGFFMHFFLITH